MAADGVELKFTRNEYKRIVRFDERNTYLVIIDSENLAQKLRLELDLNEE